jgi:hypothetical protein
LLDGNFPDPCVLFIKLYNKLPNNLFIRQLDYEGARSYILKNYGTEIVHMFNKAELDCLNKKEEKLRTVIILKNEVIMELGNNYCDTYYAENAVEMVGALKKQLSGIRRRERKTKQEINIISQGEGGLELVDMEIKRTNLDIGLHYEDDFKEIDTLIRKRLNKKNDKGIVLLHGMPGTGKTTYLRYLIGKINKQVLFIPPTLAGKIANPELVKLLVENPESVLIIEDAENVIMQRHAGMDSAVSNLLNISDGLLSDFLNVQIVCTFNSTLSQVDEALLRKGRLIAKYEFKKLTVAKSQRLSDHLGFKTKFLQPQSLADIFNQDEKVFSENRALIGFRQNGVVV